MKGGFLYFHQGYSDIINCLSLIDYYSDFYDEILLLIRYDVKETIDFYVRNKNVSIIYLDKSLLDKSNPLDYLPNNYDILFHGYHDIYRNDKFRNSFNQSIFYVEGFYTFYNIEYTNRITKFLFERDYDIEDKFYNNFIDKNGTNYIIYHDDGISSSNIYTLKEEKESKLVNFNMISNNLFETIKVLQNSKEIHLIDSVWASFCYLIDHKYNLLDNTNIYLYPFLNRGGSNINFFLDNSNLRPFHKKNWILKK
jgi:hypothetical protein